MNTPWSFLLNVGYRNVYSKSLVARGMSVPQANEILVKFNTYISRLKVDNRLYELDKIVSRTEFKEKLKIIFEERWDGHMKVSYVMMPYYFYDYIDFMDTLQAVTKEYFSEEERMRFGQLPNLIPIPALTEYETKYIKDDKLKFLANPILITYIKSAQDDHSYNHKTATTLCRQFYGTLLNTMKPSDFKKLIDQIWDGGNEIKKGTTRKKFRLSFPNGSMETLGIIETMIRLIDFYSPESVLKRKIFIRNCDFLTKTSPIGLTAKNYKLLNNGYYMYSTGNYKDNRNIIYTINNGLGEKIKVETL